MNIVRPNRIERILCIGAHSDDIEIGAGGAILKLLAERPDVEVRWVVLSANGDRGAEARSSASQFLASCRAVQVELHDFRDGYFPYVGAEIKDCFEELKKGPKPDLIFTHCREDLHQDHRLISELTWNTFRDHLIAEYEIPKYDGGLLSPNVFVTFEETVLERKIDILLSVFESQRRRRWFSADNFRGLARLRGLECNAQSGLAEGFHCRKLTLAW